MRIWVAIGAVRPTATSFLVKSRRDNAPFFTPSISLRMSRSFMCLRPFETSSPLPLSLCCKMRAILDIGQAGVLEIGWPVGLKMGWTESGAKPAWLGLSLFCIVASGALLLWAQRTIPMGTAYAVWTGIGAVGAFTVGIIAFGDQATAMRIVSIGLIVAGIVGLKLA